MICPRCGYIIDQTQKSVDIAFKFSKDLLDKRSNEFKELFANLLERFGVTNSNHIYKFLRDVSNIPDDILYKLINDNANKAMLIKGNKLAYLAGIIKGLQNE
jgi:hypothetical protein